MTITQDKDGTKILTGISNAHALMTDTAFHWFKERHDSYKSDQAAVAKITAKASSLHFIVFGGTWCSDTRDLLPAFYQVMEQAHITDSQITLYLLDRTKKAADGSTDTYSITNVPTFVVLRDGKPVGQVVESVKKNIESDIADLLK